MAEITEGGLNAAISNLMGAPTPTTVNPTNVPIPDFGLGNLQGILTFVKDFESHLTTIATQAKSILDIAQQGKAQSPTAAVMEDATPEYKEKNLPPVGNAPQINPEKVYQALMYALTKIPQDMNVKTILEMGRAHRDTIMAQIIATLPELNSD